MNSRERTALDLEEAHDALRSMVYGIASESQSTLNGARESFTTAADAIRKAANAIDAALIAIDTASDSLQQIGTVPVDKNQGAFLLPDALRRGSPRS